jgi:hypothetical protein
MAQAKLGDCFFYGKAEALFASGTCQVLPFCEYMPARTGCRYSGAKIIPGAVTTFGQPSSSSVVWVWVSGDQGRAIRHTRTIYPSMPDERSRTSQVQCRARMYRSTRVRVRLAFSWPAPEISSITTFGRSSVQEYCSTSSRHKLVAAPNCLTEYNAHDDLLRLAVSPRCATSACA